VSVKIEKIKESLDSLESNCQSMSAEIASMRVFVDELGKFIEKKDQTASSKHMCEFFENLTKYCRPEKDDKKMNRYAVSVAILHKHSNRIRSLKTYITVAPSRAESIACVKDSMCPLKSTKVICDAIELYYE
jgi:hypothetical protein